MQKFCHFALKIIDKWPKYDAGLYTDGGTSMVVSRGIGNSIIPFRFNNRPEIVLVELNAR